MLEAIEVEKYTKNTNLDCGLKWAIPVNRGTPPRRSKLINLKGQKHGFLEG